LDGSSYQNSVNDRVRDQRLNDLGYTVSRFWNNKIDNNLEGVLLVIRKELNKEQPLSSSPQAWGEKE